MNKSKVAKLKGQDLADAFLRVYPLAVANPGKVFAFYRSGAVEIGGSGLAPHPDMRAQYPNGWCLRDRVFANRARRILAAVSEIPQYLPSRHPVRIAGIVAAFLNK